MAIIKGGLLTELGVVVQVPTGDINGINAVFTTPSSYVPGSLLVFLNGLAQTPGLSNDYVELTDTTFQFNEAPTLNYDEGGSPQPDQILVYYQEAS